jgi:NADH:ubiquinone oxidoreductase subunit F (NADH-binding)/NADH:ubiquinone oxidoreductase subunit E
MLIDELRAIQERHGYIPEKDLNDLAVRLDKPVYELYGVASFYPHFRLGPPPKATVHVCTDLPCHLKGAGKLLDRLRETASRDSSVEVKNCSCLGQCDGAPAMLINDAPYARRSTEELQDLAMRALAGQRVEHQEFEGVQGPFKSDPYPDPSQHYSTLRQLVAEGGHMIASGEPNSVVSKIKGANLRGMGGAGTPAFRKWDTVQKSKSPKKYIVCNGDESEVGTFKDREVLKSLPHLLVEAMTIAGITLGADKGYIYIRHEYHEQIELLRAEIKRARTFGAVGPDVFGSKRAFDLEVFVSPGGYVQGEETALLEAIEGRRGQPRNKPWDVGLERGVPAFLGLWGKPTLINNVETFIYVPVILNKGADWFCKQGVNGCQGLKWIGVGGHVNKPGVHEIPMGLTYREIIDLCGGMLDGRELKAICPSGPTGGFLPASFADVPIDFPSYGPKGDPANAMAKAGGTAGSAAIVIIAEGTCLVDAALNYTRFYRNESCGKCVPCRVGSQKIVDIIAGVAQGTARENDLAEIDRLADTLMMTSICGLGQVVPSPIKSVMKYFFEEVEDHRIRRTCPSGICFSGAGKVENTNSAAGKI